MNTSALILMVSTMSTVIIFTAYFFWKVLTIPQRPEPDSYIDNDDENK